MYKMRLNINKIRLNINKIWLNINKIRLNINLIRLNTNKMRLNINKMWLNINKIRLNTNKMRLNINKMRVNIFKLNIKKTLIDVILTNKPKCFFNSHNLVLALSELYKLTLSILRAPFKNLPPKVIIYKKIKSLNQDVFLHDLDSRLNESLETC